MNIRSATPADYDRVARLNAEVQQLHAEALPHLFKPASSETFTREVFEAMLARPHCSLYLAETDGQSAGYLYLEVVDRPETWARYAHRALYVHQLCVARTHGRRGFGQQLLEHAADLATRQGIARLELDVWSFNTTARALFERRGFQESNIRMAHERLP
jgi:ribosomal protein S18 acetylase RimI-like enzyme